MRTACSAEKGEVRGQGDVKGDFEGGWGEAEQPKLGNHTWPGTGSWAGRSWHSGLWGSVAPLKAF